MQLASPLRPLLIYVVRGESWNPLPSRGIGEIENDPRKSGSGGACHFMQHRICQFMHRLMVFPHSPSAGWPPAPANLPRNCWHRACRNDPIWIGRRSPVLRTSTSTLPAILPMAWAFFCFFEGKKESRAMEKTRGVHPPLLECLAVVAALALQFASVITLLQEHAAR